MYCLSKWELKKIFADRYKDPVVYFYRIFTGISEGHQIGTSVYYTPDAVVQSMVESVDEQLKEVYGLPLDWPPQKHGRSILFCPKWLSGDKTKYLTCSNRMNKKDVFVRIWIRQPGPEFL